MTNQINLTANELKAALIMLNECLAGMGGSKPEDLEHDEYTWVNVDMLTAHGYKLASAKGTMGSLTHKGIITEADTNEYALDGWRDLIPAWYEAEGKERVAPEVDETAKDAEAPKKVSMCAAIRAAALEWQGTRMEFINAWHEAQGVHKGTLGTQWAKAHREGK